MKPALKRRSRRHGRRRQTDRWNKVSRCCLSVPRTIGKIAHAITKPLLYVVTPQYQEQAANLQKNRPGTEVEVFTDAGHALFVDEPERFNALIGKFAESLSRR
jgi:pimeloyl-ACP methyl ester carboxylesterase